MPKQPGAKINPKSLENLKLGRQPGYGRTLDYDQPKRRHGVTVTDVGWQGLESLAQRANVSVSELLERIGRGYFNLIEPAQLEVLESCGDLESSYLRLVDLPETPLNYKQVRTELGLPS